MVVADEDIAVHLTAEIAVVLHPSHRVTVSYTGCVQIVLETLVTSFISETALDVEPIDNIVLDGASECIAVAVNYRLFPVEHPVRVFELFHRCICPVVDIHIPDCIEHLEVVLVIVPVLASREQVCTWKRVVEES